MDKKLEKLSIFLDEKTTEVLKVKPIMDLFKMDENDVILLTCFYTLFPFMTQNIDRNIYETKTSLSLSEKYVRDKFKKNKTTSLKKIFLKKLFNNKYVIQKSKNETKKIECEDFFFLLKEMNKDKLTKFNVEKYDFKDPREVTLLFLYFLALDDDEKALEKKSMIFLEKANINKILEKEGDYITDIIIHLFEGINNFVIDDPVTVRLSVSANLDMVNDIIDSNHEKEKNNKKKKNDDIKKLKKENERLKKELSEKNEIISLLTQNNSTKLRGKKILLIADRQRKDEYFSMLKNFGMEEDNFYLLDGFEENKKVKKYSNVVDYVILFRGFTKHASSFQLKNFPSSVQIVKMNQTGLFQLYSAILQLK